MTTLDEALELVADANRVLVRQNVLDAFGHVSMRSPEDPEQFLISRNLAPALVQASDVQIYDLEGRTPDPRPGYLERFIHSEIYRRRPDVNAVVHSHSASVIPFSISEKPLRAVWHMGSFLGEQVPVFEIRDRFGDATDLLIRNPEMGAALAEACGDHAAALMRGHGSVAVGDSLPSVVYRAVFTELNARVQVAAESLGDYTPLTAGEGVTATESISGQIQRAWEIWRSEVTTP